MHVHVQYMLVNIGGPEIIGRVYVVPNNLRPAYFDRYNTIITYTQDNTHTKYKVNDTGSPDTMQASRSSECHILWSLD